MRSALWARGRRQEREEERGNRIERESGEQSDRATGIAHLGAIFHVLSAHSRGLHGCIAAAVLVRAAGAPAAKAAMRLGVCYGERASGSPSRSPPRATGGIEVAIVYRLIQMTPRSSGNVTSASARAALR